MKMHELYQPSGSLTLSFELFPPKSEEGDPALMETVAALCRFSPRFITCTYGAGGSTRRRTLDIVHRVKKRFQLPVASHLTCVGSTADDIREYLQRAAEWGIDHIVALRGDPPKGEQSFTPVTNGFHYASELVAFIRREFPNFGIAVAGYPEVHQEALSPQADLENLKRKVELGGDVVITQLFYHNDDFYRFWDQTKAIGIEAPIVPGILPVTSLGQIQRIAQMCRATLPESFLTRLAERDDAEWQTQVGVEFATEQVADLIQHGVPGIHFYVLNKSRATSDVLTSLGTLSK